MKNLSVTAITITVLAFCSQSQAQYSPAEKQAFRITRSIVTTVGTVIIFRIYGSHGEPIDRNVRMILSFNAGGELRRLNTVRR